MGRPLPLLALRAFAEAGRQGSIKSAATALGVTAGAVSQQIRQLEDRLGVALFERRNRAITLTREGQDLLGPALAAFDGLSEAFEHAERTRARAGTVLRISTTASFAATWLVPRLGRFAARHPEIELRVGTTAELVPIGRAPGSADIAIRHGLGAYPGLEAVRLLQPRLLPVASPSMLAHGPPIASPADCLAYPLLQDGDRADWLLWLRAQGIADADGRARRGPSFSDDLLLVQAAVAGQGIALVRDTYAAGEIAAGRLAPAIDAPWPASFAYYLVYPVGAPGRSNSIARFRDWILEEVARETADGEADAATRSSSARDVPGRRS